MKYLLDTHILVWWLLDDRRLSRGHRRILERIERQRHPVGVASISLWEIAKLAERGRLKLQRAVDSCLQDIETSDLVEVLPLSARVAAESTRLGASYPSDPADQIIGATARCHGLALLTADERITDSGVIAVG